MNEEPTCAPPPASAPADPGHAHNWFVLGKEDNGETVSRCNHCHTLRYEKGGDTRYETPAA